ncbi:hypothetical protein [Anaeromicropila populeti]|uniref:Uncharacterized protein n=1 Tax=Anaeromicropila populeti TaxID=37658 RepID=A0A1I6HTP4_9FIRM|nr:hypothetical protein [Anaeromicropila populeti]SFR57831.1 hypothetical protein SAMN05661086_00283 [Anaeromicropila populeti]
MQNSNIIEYVKDTVYSYINSGGNNIPMDNKYLIATVAGEGYWGEYNGKKSGSKCNRESDCNRVF